ncbi:cytosine/adenosine deaminase-related metal-dependent hydrolase [Spinactinospora alkalitolerans]|uniref:Cytosine/adenosine deaminase-related metal-dependent hydrolase n=1 Tax=Spinactinospora alkalitolerans TaxID=687207 RepID=A0A852U0U8_9ACTN|nr:amidohydrolase family protein [Spinactinospora alkalitolerans]NYE48962.1 cytosine/adenosine deaminase-related metal-dependent hydrolase [Spinactinospora alkalitolerans]
MNELTPDRFDAGPALLAPELVLLPEGPAREHAAVVADGVFTAVGPLERLRREHPDLTPVALPGHLLMPGFVDAHHHLTQVLGSSLAFGEPSEIFRRVWIPLEGELDEESAHLSAKLASLQALRGGFTTVAEAGTRAPVDVEAVAAATREAGLRCVLGLVCNDVGEPGTTPSEVLARAEKHLARYEGDDLVHASLAVSIPEAATERTLRDTAGLAREAGAVVQIHVNEHLASVERSLVRHGVRPLEHLDRAGALGPQLLAAHATLLTAAEVELLRGRGAAVSYNPIASAWKGDAVAPALTLAQTGVRFGLGTDGTRGDAFRLLDAAESAQRIAYGLTMGDSSCGGGWTWLEHGTRASADAVGLGALTGEIAAGRAADFLLVDVTVPELRPSWDLPWELVRLADRDQITAVVVGGRLRLWKGWPTDWDGRALVERAAEVGREVVARARITRAHPVSTEHRARNGAR